MWRCPTQETTFSRTLEPVAISSAPSAAVISRKLRWLIYPALLLLCVVYFFWAHAKVLGHPLRANDDVVQHLLWLFDGPWADDFYARTSGVIQPWGYKAVVAFLGLFTDPLTLSRYGPLLITVLNVGFVTGILRRYFPLVFAVAAAFFVNHAGLTVSVGFLARAWCIPCLLGFGYALVAVRTPRAIGIALVLSALFYPPALLINGGVAAVVIFYRVMKDNRVMLQQWPITVGAVVALGIAGLQSYYIRSHPDLGAMMDWDTLSGMAEFRGGGRVDFSSFINQPSSKYFHLFLIQYLPLAGGVWFAYLVPILFAAVAVVYRRRIGLLAAWLVLWTGTSLLLYQLAKWLVPLLFLPDRYLIYPWKPLTALVLVTVVGALVIRWPRPWFGGLAGLLLLAYGLYLQPPQQLYVVRGEFDQNLYETIAALPDTVMIAGPPRIMSQVPLFSRRSVLVTQEAAHALYFEHFYDYVTPRFTDQIKAYAAPADSLQLVLDFADKYSVDYLVVHPESLQKGDALAYQPHNRWFKEQTAGRAPDDFALLAVPDSLRQILRKDNYFMVATEDLRQLNAQRTTAPKPPE